MYVPIQLYQTTTKNNVNYGNWLLGIEITKGILYNIDVLSFYQKLY